MNAFDFHRYPIYMWLQLGGNLFEKSCIISMHLAFSYLSINLILKLVLMPSPSADPKFSLSILKFLSKLKFLKYTQNVLSILK